MVKPSVIYLRDDIWYDPDGTLSVMLDISDKIEPPVSQTIDGLKMLPKDEYHCTLVSVKKMQQEARQSVLDIVKNTSAQELHFDRLGDDFYVCKSEKGQTLVRQVYLVGYDEFVDRIRQVVPDFKTPFLHATLLKSEGFAPFDAIGIKSAEELKQLCYKFKPEND